MGKDAGMIMAEFNNAATRIYYAITDQFTCAFFIDRPLDENIFHLQSGRYAYMLKCRLEELATKILKTYPFGTCHDQLGYALSAKVNYYVQQFRIKSQLL